MEDEKRYSEGFTNLYNTSVSQLGLSDSIDKFYDYFKNNSRNVYDYYVKNKGLTDSYEQFMSYVDIGNNQSPQAPSRVDVSDVEGGGTLPTVRMTDGELSAAPSRKRDDASYDYTDDDYSQETVAARRQRRDELQNELSKINRAAASPQLGFMAIDDLGRKQGLQDELRQLDEYFGRYNTSDDMKDRIADSEKIAEGLRKRDGLKKNSGRFWRLIGSTLYSAENANQFAGGQGQNPIEFTEDDANNMAADAIITDAEKKTKLAKDRLNAEGRLSNEFGFTRGFKNTDWKSLSSAVTLNEYGAVLSLMQKMARGGELTDSENNLLDALRYRAMIDDTFVDEMWERIGMNATEQLKFTAEFVLTGYAGARTIGGKAGEKALNGLSKSFVKNALKKETAKKAVAKGVELGTIPLMQTLYTTPDVIAGTMDRMAGDFGYNESTGQFEFYGGEGFGEALAKSFGSSYKENLTEATGDYLIVPFKGVNYWMRKWFKGYDRFVQDAGRALDRIKSGKLAEAFSFSDEFVKATGMNGVFGEYAEEFVGNIIDAAFIGDMTFRKYKRDENGDFVLDGNGDRVKNENWMFDGKQNLETFLSCAVMTMTMGLPSGIANQSAKSSGRRQAQSLLNQYAAAAENEGLDTEAIDDAFGEDGGIEGITDALLKECTRDGVTDQQRMTLTNYTLAKLRLSAMRNADTRAVEAMNAQIAEQARRSVNGSTTDRDGNGGHVILANVEVNGQLLQNVAIVRGNVRTRIKPTLDGRDVMEYDAGRSDNVLYVKVPGQEKPVAVWKDAVREVVSSTPIEQYIKEQQDMATGAILATLGEQYDGKLPLEQLAAECAVVRKMDTERGTVSGAFEKGVKYNAVIDGKITRLEYVGGTDTDSGRINSFRTDDGDALSMTDREAREAFLDYRVTLARESGTVDAQAEEELEISRQEGEAENLTRPMSRQQQVYVITNGQVGDDGKGNYTADSNPRAVALQVLSQCGFDKEMARQSLQKTIDALAVNAVAEAENEVGGADASTSLRENIAGNADARIVSAAEVVAMYRKAVDVLDAVDAFFNDLRGMEIGDTFSLYDADGNETVAVYNGLDEEGEVSYTVMNAGGIPVFKSATLDELYSNRLDHANREAERIFEEENANKENGGENTEEPQPVINDGNGGVDAQGNLLNSDGSVFTEKINSIDELADADFDNPTRSIELPTLPDNVANAIGTNGRPVVIKKNVFVKNGETHVELDAEESREILSSALYNPNLVGRTQPKTRPDYKVAIRTGDKNSVVVLDIYEDKKQVDIVGWRRVNEKGLEKMKKQAEREGGQFLILSPEDGSAAALSALPQDLNAGNPDVSGGKDNTKTNTEEGNYEKKSIPLDKDGNIDHSALDPEDAETYSAAVNAEADNAAEFASMGDADYVRRNMEAAAKAVEKAGKMKPKSTGAAQLKKELADINAKRAAAKRLAEFWDAVGKEAGSRASARLAEEMASEEKAETKAGAVGQNVKDRWDGAQKIEGSRASRTLADGTVIKGRYMLVPANAMTPSHDYTKGYATSEGFPLNENGSNINDRDYRNDRNAQVITEGIARDYDGQAVSQVPVVSPDGVVYDGNGRTIAGQMAAANNTDAKYTQALVENAAMFGFSADDVMSVPDARVVFVTDEVLPYTTGTFAKFNRNDKKTQSNTEKAIAKSKTLNGRQVSAIASIMDEYETLDSLFSSEVASAKLMKVLQETGVIGSNEVAEMIENGRLNATGREYVENVVIGSVFNEETIRRIGANQSLRRSVLRAIMPIIENSRLGEYSLAEEINNAISLVYEAKEQKKSVILHLRQGDAFNGFPTDRYSEMEQELAMSMDDSVGAFRDMLGIYNRKAADVIEKGGADMFDGVLTKNDVINEVLTFIKSKKNGDKGTTTDTNRADEGRGAEEKGSGHKEDAPASGVQGDGNGQEAGVLGTVYNQFAGKVREAIEFLKQKKSGFAKDVLTHPQIQGGIGLYWGNQKAGLEKILAKHPDILDNLQEILNETSIVASSDNRIVLESPTHKVVVSKMLGDKKTDNWVLSAYEKNDAQASSSDIETRSDDLGNGTAAPQSINSGGKDTQISDTQDKKKTDIEGKSQREPKEGQTKEQKAGEGVAEASKAQKAMVEALVGHLNGMGVEATTDVEEGQRILDMANGRAQTMSAEEADQPKQHKAGAPSPVFYSNAFRAVEGIKQEKATPEQWLAMLQKNGGLKAGEDKWLGLSEWLKASDKKSLTKQEVQDYIAENQIQIEEVGYEEFDTDNVLDYYTKKSNPINETRLEYTTQGLGSKREIALVVPTIEPYNANDKIHFGDAGEGRAVAWARFGDATDAEGNRVLVIDEIQSKRHQDGREEGYSLPAPTEYFEIRKEFFDYSDELMAKYPAKDIDDLIDNYLTPEEKAKRRQLEKSYVEIAKNIDTYGVPDAPFDKNWHELAMKRMLRYAAENGYDKVAWTTGAQQAVRYNMAQYVNHILSERKDADSKYIDIVLKDAEAIYLVVNNDGKVLDGFYYGNRVVTSKYNDQNLTEIVGKEMANRLLTEDGEINEKDMMIGGEGMKGFYDKMLPNFVDKYGKKWGAKTADVTLDLPNEADRVMHSVDVTPEMKESVMEGQPMFFKTEDGEVYGFVMDGKIYIDPRIATSETPIHEYTHLWAAALRKANPKAWERLKKLMDRERDLMDYVKRKYPELAGNEDALMDEVFAHYSGKRGKERLDAEMKAEMDNAKDVFETAKVSAIFGKIKAALDMFWNMARDLFAGSVKGLNKMKAEDFADMAMNDLLNKFNPKNNNGIPAAGQKTLVGMHNISEEKLRKALKLGGYANPSVAVVDTRKGVHTDYGEITLIPASAMIDKQRGRNAGTWLADAWTPTYPQVSKMPGKGTEKALKQILKEWAGNESDEAIRNALKKNLDYFVYGYTRGGSEHLQYQFLKEKGMQPEIFEKTNGYDKDFYAFLKDLSEETGVPITELAFSEHGDRVAEYIGRKNGERFVKSLNESLAKKGKPVLTKEKERQYITEHIDEWKNKIGVVDSEVYDTYKKAQRPETETDVEKTFSEAGFTVSKSSELRKEYEKWLADLDERLGMEEKLFAGFTPSGKRRYLANTLENVSMLMNKGGQAGNTGWTGAGPFIAKIAEQANTLDKIRRNKGKLIGNDQGFLHEEAKQHIYDEFYELSQVLNEGYGVWDSVGEARMEEIAGMKGDIRRYLKREYGVEVSDEWMQRYNDLVYFIRKEYPVYYFETKFNRPVELWEFRHAIVPYGTGEDVVEGLKRAGVQVAFYDRAVEGDRERVTMEVANSNPGVVFHRAAETIQQTQTEAETEQMQVSDEEITSDYAAAEAVINQLKSVGITVHEISEEEADESLDDADVQHHVVKSDEEKSELEEALKDGTERRYCAMQVIDGKLYPVMSAYDDNGEIREASEIGRWEKSDEDPDAADANGNYRLRKTDSGKGRPGMGDTPARYNPYFHVSDSPLNDQFSGASTRPNVVIVEVEVPVSEKTSGYHAENAKDSVGELQWHSGPVNSQLTNQRTVMLSRWRKPVRIVPYSEVADMIVRQMGDDKPQIPFNTLHPELRGELEKRGVEINDEWDSRTGKGNPFKDGKDTTTRLKTSAGIVYGYAKGGEIYLNRERLNPDTPIHEYTHLWDEACRQANPELWRRGVELMKQTSEWARVMADENYRDIRDDEDKVASEVHSRLAGRYGAEVLGQMQREAEEAGTAIDMVEKMSLLDRVKTWVNDFWKWVKDTLTPWTMEEAAKVSVEDFVKMPIGDLFRGVNPNEYMDKSKEQLDNEDDTRYQIIQAQNEIDGVQELFDKTLGITREVVKDENNLDTVKTKGGLKHLSRAAYTTIMDGMHTIKAAQDAIAEKRGRKIADNENAYMSENVRSSVGREINDRQKRQYIEPMIKAFANMLVRLNGRTLFGRNIGRTELEDYMIAKHGIERNEYMYRREVEEYERKRDAEYDKYVLETTKANNERLKGGGDNLMTIKTKEEFFKEKDNRSYSVYLAWMRRNRPDETPMERDAYLESKRPQRRDASGLTELARKYGLDTDDFNGSAQRIVDEVESMAGGQSVDVMWKKVKNATDAILANELRYGMILKDVYDSLKAMFMYYVPLRGWQKDMSDVMHDYSQHKKDFAYAMKKMEGRRSIAFSPLSFIETMLQTSVVAGEKNRVLQKLYNLGAATPNDLIKVGKVWYMKTTDGNGNEVVQIMTPDIKDGMTQEQINAELTAFEERMSALEASSGGDVWSEENKAAAMLPIMPMNESDHVMQVMINGQRYCIITADPSIKRCFDERDSHIRAFMPKADEIWTNVTRGMSKIMTTYNPEFFVRNTMRDIFTSLIGSWIEGGRAYQKALGRNIRHFAAHDLRKLIRYGRCGNSLYDQYWNEFLTNGGETGFTRVLSSEKNSADIDRMLDNLAKGREIDSETWVRYLGSTMEGLNRWGEDLCRFAAYVTNRERGKSVMDSTAAAKRITVNFNTKGKSGFARFMCSHFSFFNATVQGLNRVMQLAGNNTGRFLAATAGLMFSGILFPIANLMLISAFGDDEDELAYMFMSDYISNHNLVIFNPFGGGFITIPYPQEFAPVMAIGNIVVRHLLGWDNDSTMAADIARGFLETLPIDLSSSEGDFLKTVVTNLTPTAFRPIMDCLVNQNFMGRQVYTSTPYNQEKPSWTKAPSNTLGFLVAASRWANSNDPVMKRNGEFFDNVLNNPAVYQHLFEGYTGGIGRFINNVYKFGESVMNGDADFSYMPVVRSLYLTSDIRKYGAGIKSEYYKMVQNTERANTNYKAYDNKKVLENKKGLFTGFTEAADRQKMIGSSADYKMYERLHGGAGDENFKQIKELNNAYDFYKANGLKKDMEEVESDRVSRMLEEVMAYHGLQVGEQGKDKGLYKWIQEITK